MSAPHALYIDAVVAELLAAGIPPLRVTLTTHYDSAQEPLKAELHWDHETDRLSYNHWPRGLIVLWDDSFGWHHVGDGSLPLDPISPPKTIAAAIDHLMAHGPGRIDQDRTTWEHTNLLTAINRDRRTYLPDGYSPHPQATTRCP